MSRWTRSVMAGLLVMACTTLCARADDKDDIKACGKAFHAALKAGDASAAKKQTVSDEKSDKFVETMTGLVMAKNKLNDAAVAKFGDDGKAIVNSRGPGSMISMDNNFEDAEINVTGDTATVTFKNAPRPVVFKKDGGAWKIDFSEIAHQDQVERGLPIMEKMTTAMNDTAKDITDGKFATVQEAQAGLRQKMAAAISFPSGGAGGGRP